MHPRSLTVAAVFSAALASMCCILPLSLGVVGLSGAALSAFFEPLRPYLLALAATLLGLAYYFAFRAPRQAGASCDVEGARLARHVRFLLGLATAAVVALAFFPSIASFAVGGAGQLASDGSVPSALVVLDVDGMTCEACAPEVRRRLLEVPGVLDAAVSYPRQVAEVRVRDEQGPKVGDLVEAVRAAGYEARERVGSP